MEIKPWSKEVFTEAPCGFFWDQFNPERAKRGKVRLDRFMGLFSKKEIRILAGEPDSMARIICMFLGMKPAVDLYGCDRFFGEELGGKMKSKLSGFFRRSGCIFFDPDLVAEVIRAAEGKMKTIDSVNSAVGLFEQFDSLAGLRREEISKNMHHDFGLFLGYIPKDVEIWCDINLGQNSQLEDVAWHAEHPILFACYSRRRYDEFDARMREVILASGAGPYMERFGFGDWLNDASIGNYRP